MLEFLKKKGYLPIRTEPDFNDPKYSVWVFESSEGLYDAIEDYLEMRAKQRKEEMQ